LTFFLFVGQGGWAIFNGIAPFIRVNNLFSVFLFFSTNLFLKGEALPKELR